MSKPNVLLGWEREVPTIKDKRKLKGIHEPKCVKNSQAIRACAEPGCKSKILLCKKQACQCFKSHKNCRSFMNFTLMKKIVSKNIANVLDPLLKYYQNLAELALKQYEEVSKMKDYFLLKGQIGQFIKEIQLHSDTHTLNLCETVMNLTDNEKPENLKLNAEPFEKFIKQLKLNEKLQQLKQLRNQLSKLRDEELQRQPKLTIKERLKVSLPKLQDNHFNKIKSQSLNCFNSLKITEYIKVIESDSKNINESFEKKVKNQSQLDHSQDKSHQKLKTEKETNRINLESEPSKQIIQEKKQQQNSEHIQEINKQKSQIQQNSKQGVDISKQTEAQKQIQINSLHKEQNRINQIQQKKQQIGNQQTKNPFLNNDKKEKIQIQKQVEVQETKNNEIKQKPTHYQIAAQNKPNSEQRNSFTLENKIEDNQPIKLQNPFNPFKPKDSIQKQQPAQQKVLIIQVITGQLIQQQKKSLSNNNIKFAIPSGENNNFFTSKIENSSTDQKPFSFTKK